MCRPELLAQVRVFATGNGGKTDPSTRTPSRTCRASRAEPDHSHTIEFSDANPPQSVGHRVAQQAHVHRAFGGPSGIDALGTVGANSGCSSGGKGELSPVVVVVPGRVVVDVLDGHVLLEVGVPAHREVHAPPELGVGVLLETRHQMCNDEVERLVHSGVAENSRAAEGSHVVNNVKGRRGRVEDCCELLGNAAGRPRKGSHEDEQSADDQVPEEHVEEQLVVGLFGAVAFNNRLPVHACSSAAGRSCRPSTLRAKLSPRTWCVTGSLVGVALGRTPRATLERSTPSMRHERTPMRGASMSCSRRLSVCPQC